MTHVARLYSTRETADSAADALKKRGFDAGLIHVVHPPAAAAPAPVAEPVATHEGAEPLEPAAAHEAPAAPPVQQAAKADPAADPSHTAVGKTGLRRASVEIYAEHVRKGASLVVFDAPFSMGQTAENILARFNPIAVHVPWVDRRGEAGAGGDNAAPLSAALGWKVLASDPTPLSSWLGWRTLLPERETSATLETVRRQSGEGAPLSRLLRLPTLSGNPAPFSGAVKARVLSDAAAPLSEKAKFRTLLDDPAPLSSRLGWRTISSNPAPLSALLGLPVLISSDAGRRAPDAPGRGL